MELYIFIIAGIILVVILFKIVKAFFKWAFFLIVVVATAYFTNPPEETHRESLREMLKSEDLKRVRNKFVSVKDYKIFSVTKVELEKKEHDVGLGVFGKIWYILGIPPELQK